MISTKLDETPSSYRQQRVLFIDLISDIGSLTVETILTLSRLGRELSDGEIDMFDFEDDTEKILFDAESQLIKALFDNPKIRDAAIESLRGRDFRGYAKRTPGWNKTKMGNWVKNNVMFPWLEKPLSFQEKTSMLRKISDAENIRFSEAWRRVLKQWR